MKKLLLILPVAALLLSLGCGDSHPHEHAGHRHEPPYGGTPVVLGTGQFHLVFVRNPQAGRLTAYVMDDHLHEFIRIRERLFEVEASVEGRTEILSFKPVPNAATGETAGNTSQFEAQADWLMGVAEFDAVLRQIEVAGNTFENIGFNFPKGHEVHSH